MDDGGRCWRDAPPLAVCSGVRRRRARAARGWQMVAATICLLLGPWMAVVETVADTRTPDFPSSMRPVDFADIPGWDDDDHTAAFAAFLRTCEGLQSRPTRTRVNGVSAQALSAVCRLARQDRPISARAFFEQHFTPMAVEREGLLTGYFEPQLRASAERTGEFRHPLYARPPDLVELPRPPDELGLPDTLTWGRRIGPQGSARYEPFPDRGAIMAGALDGQGLEIAWLDDPIDVFFTHIQGSARLAMTDGSVRRVNFAGKSGHPYTPIGRTLVERGAMALEDVTMQSIRDWLNAADDDDRDAVLATNRSYIFFAMTDDTSPELGPVAAAGVPLTPGRSLAVDRHLHTFGSPIFVHSQEGLPGDQRPLQRLMIAQDTGSAIVGPARGDIFIGSGHAAGALAGRVNMAVTFIVLVPKSPDLMQPISQ